MVGRGPGTVRSCQAGHSPLFVSSAQAPPARVFPNNNAKNEVQVLEFLQKGKYGSMGDEGWENDGGSGGSDEVILQTKRKTWAAICYSKFKSLYSERKKKV